MSLPSVDLEAEYNNRARVPEHPEIMAGWKRDAAAYRSARKSRSETGVKYGPHARHTVDFFAPDTPKPASDVVLIIHGGYWRSLDPSMFSHWAAGVNAHGYVAALPGYRLCPDATLSDIVADIRTAALLVHRRYDRPLLVVGHSAGGHLAAALAATDWPAFGGGAPADLIRGCLAISGLFDLVPLVSTSINEQLRLDESARALSPAFWPPAEGVNCDVLVGAEESSEYLRQSRLLADKWAAAGARARFATVPGANHFTSPAGLSDPESDTIAALLALGSDT